MPIHDLGYRAWQGRSCSEAMRWWVIAQTGFRLAWKTAWLRRLVMVAWLPAFYMGVAFFVYEQSASQPEMRGFAVSFFRGFWDGEGREIYANALAADPATGRHEVWGWLLLLFFRHPQGVLMALAVGLIAPPLISQDLRSRAFLLYFSRPITRLEYVCGKLAVVCLYVGLITTAPALTLYAFGVLLSPDLSVLQYTWDFPLRILAASVVLMVPTTAIALAFSSLTTRSYFAGFSWFAVWAFGFITYYFLVGTLEDQKEWWSLVSLHHTLGKVQTWIFDLGTDFSQVLPSLALLVGVTAASMAVVFYRVTRCLRV